MESLYKKVIYITTLLIFLMAMSHLSAQVTVRYSGNATGLTTTCTDAVWSNDPDRSFELEIRPVSVAPQIDGGGRVTVAGSCGTSGSTNFGTRDGDITLYCSGTVVRLRGRAGESDAALDCGGLDCATPWTAWSNYTVNNTANQTWGPVAVSGSGSSGNLSSTISFSGNFRANAVSGSTNFSCATAWALPVNGTGTPISGHTTNCGDAWYRYELTDANRSYIEFEPTAGGLNTSQIVEVKYVNCTGCDLGVDASWWGNAYRVTNPRVGYYYVRVRVNQTWGVGSNDFRFDLEVRKGATVSIPANDNLCNATNLHSAFNYTSGNLSGSSNTSSASSEDVCSMNEPESDNEKTVWYKFTTGANPPTSVNINPSAGDWDDYGVAILYRQNSTPNCAGYPVSNFFSFMSKVGESTLGSSFNVNCLAANTTYYLQLFTRESVPLPGTKDDGPISFTITNSGAPVPTNDLPCNAISIGVSTPGSTISTTNSKANNNFCVGSSGEGSFSTSFTKHQTVWYTFTTGATVGAEIKVNVNSDPFGYGDEINSEVAVYKIGNGNICAPTGIVRVDEDEQLVPVGWYSASADFCPDPNSTYLILVDHDNAFTAAGEGYFDIDIIQNNLIKGPDYICLPASSTTPGVDGYLGVLNSSNNTDLVLNSQTNKCAGVTSGEPDNTGITSLNRTTWYRFRTPAADYSDNTLMHLYDVIAERRSSTPGDVPVIGTPTTFPDVYLYKSTSAGGRACGDGSGDYANLQFIDTDAGDVINNDGRIRDLCLEPNTDYYIQIDVIGISDYVDYNIRIKKSAFRPGNRICDATVVPTSAVAGFNHVTTISQPDFTAAPMFGLPHSNKCASADTGEPDVSPGGPATSGGHTASVWYKFTTDGNPAEWIEWDHDDIGSGRAVRGTLCVGIGFNTKINIYESSVNSCVYPSLILQSEFDKPLEVPGASLLPGIYRLRCPQPNTTYYVQVKDMSVSPCFEGIYEPKITTAITTIGTPVNDDPCGAIFLGTVPAGGTLAPATIFNNFCATPTKGFIADQTQPLERDVWFSFIAPPSGSVLITSESAPSGSPSADNDLDLQIAIWEPILGDHLQNPHCSSPRYLWTPIVSRDHDILDYADVPIVSTTYYDILDTRNNLLNEGNSLIATCLNPGKMYYIQVDGGDYLLCDFFNGGNCLMGYFDLKIKDAGLYDMASMATQPAGNDEPCGAKNIPVSSHSGALQWTVGSNLCATAINDPLPGSWYSSDATVWYKFIAPASGKVKIRAENINQINRRDKANPNSPSGLLTQSDPDYHEEINLQLAVYTLGNCMSKGSLVEHTSSYDGALVENNPTDDDNFVGLLTNGFDEYLVARCLIPGKEYFIVVDGENDPNLGVITANIEDVVGDFRISVQDYATVPASVNDDVCDAFEILNVHTLGINANRTTGWFNNECATIQPNIEGPGKVAEEMRNSLTPTILNVDAKKTLWYKFRAPASGKVLIQGLNSGNDKIDLAMAVYDFPGENCNLAASGFKVGEDFDPGVIAWGEDEDLEVKCLVPNRYYYLQVDGAENPVACIPGSLCAVGEFRIRITHLADDPRSDVLPQNNDDFCNAINLGALNPGNVKTRLNDNNRCSTEEINEPGGSGWNFSLFDDQLRSVWYRFKTGLNLGPLAPGKFTITVNDPSGTCLDLDIDLFEYNGTFTTAACQNLENSNAQFSHLLKVGKGTPLILSPRSEELEIDCPKPNTDYFLRVTGTSICPGFGSTMGEFDVRVEMDGISIMAAQNDDICGSTNSAAGNMGNLGSGGSLQRLNHNNFCASQELGEPNTSQSAVQSEPEYDETMWYRFKTPSNPGEIKVRLETVITAGFASVPSITVYKGNSAGYNPCNSGFGGLVEVASDMGAAAAWGIADWDAGVTLPCPSPDWYYFVQVDGGDASLWGFTIPGFDDNFAYNLFVTDNGSGSTRPSNDKLVNAIPVDDVAPIDGQLTVGGSLTVKGNNMCATAEDNEPRVESGYNGSNTTDHQSALEDETVWFYFTTPNKPGIINVRVEDDPAYSESFSPNFAIFYNNGTNPTYRITGAPTAQIIQEGTESTAITGTSTNKNYTCLLPNTKYYIQVDGNDLVPGRVDQGRFIVTVTDNGAGNPGPANDLICNSEDVTSSLVNGGTMTINRTNMCSWEEVSEPNTSNNMGGTGDDVTANDYDETVWFKFRPAWEGQYTITVSNSHNYILYRSTAGSYNCNAPVWTNLTQMSTSNGLNTGQFSCLDDNVWYYIQVDGDDGPGDDVGAFALSIAHVSASIPTHDMICSAYNLGTINGATSTASNQNNICATQEIDEPNTNGDYYNINSLGYDKTLWYRFTTPAQIGDWTINVTNNSPYADRISGTFTLYQSTGANPCSGGTPVWSNLTDRMSAGVANVTNGNNSLSIECYRLSPNTNYFIQVHGEDAGVFGEVGTNFDVSVTHTPAIVGTNDNVCSPVALTVGGAAYSDNNICAGTQVGEPDISPSPQNPYTSGYDETMWYSFVAPAEGYVKIEGRSLASDPIDLNMNLYELPAGATTICTGGIPNWSLLNKIGSDDEVSYNFDYENECLIPGRRYFFKIDGLDLAGLDRGNYTVRVLNNYIAQSVTCPVIANDEPCGLTGAYDITAWVRDTRCPSNSMNYPAGYSIFDGSPDIDCARRSAVGMSCGSRTNCSDYWFQFTVPMDSEGGVKIQGDDEYGALGSTNSTLVIGAYRGNPCTGQMQFLGCDYGGVGRDPEFDIAAIPGETIYLQVFNDNGAASPSTPQFGLCVSTQCAPKNVCSVVPSLEYDIPQCWNLDEDNSPLGNSGGQYGNCLPGGATSANYFTFSTECGATADGLRDTVTLVFSVNNISSNTAIAIYEDATPCDGTADGILVNCVPFGNCTGCSPSTTFTQTYQLDECKTYVIQVLGEDDDDDGSSGQIYIFKSTLEPPVLPIELLSFTGYNDGANNVLNWNTASEKNADQFLVEKSKDGIRYEVIGIVGANGNSTVLQQYSFLDTDVWTGDNFYRLRMVDFDGKYEYSNAINIVIEKQSIPDAKTAILSVYPNPTDGKTRVEMFVNEANADFEIKVTNVLGQNMHAEFMTFSKGKVSFEVDATKYAQGTYIISITNKNTSESMDAKFVKQ